ncbi:MAG: hypothetical protein Q8Q36_02685 [bacterium]|nr:hypothetical protein [bacterium]
MSSKVLFVGMVFSVLCGFIGEIVTEKPMAFSIYAGLGALAWGLFWLFVLHPQAVGRVRHPRTENSIPAGGRSRMSGGIAVPKFSSQGTWYALLFKEIDKDVTKYSYMAGWSPYGVDVTMEMVRPELKVIARFESEGNNALDGLLLRTQQEAQRLGIPVPTLDDIIAQQSSTSLGLLYKLRAEVRGRKA